MSESIITLNRYISRIKENKRFNFEKVHCMVFAYAFSKFLELENVEYSCSFLNNYEEIEKCHGIIHVALSFAHGRYLLDINGIKEITEEFTAGDFHRLVNSRFKMDDVETLTEDELLRVPPIESSIKIFSSSALELIMERIGENRKEIKRILEEINVFSCKD